MPWSKHIRMIISSRDAIELTGTPIDFRAARSCCFILYHSATIRSLPDVIQYLNTRGVHITSVSKVI